VPVKTGMENLREEIDSRKKIISEYGIYYNFIRITIVLSFLFMGSR
jgi:hypothetical protein